MAKPGMAQDRGLTLVEMLVVLAIMAVVAGLATLGLGAGDGAGAEAEARGLAAALEGAADDAMLAGAPRVLVADRRGYAVDGAPRRDLPLDMRLTAPERLAIRADGAGATATLVVSAPAGDWTIAFDGAAATVARR